MLWIELAFWIAGFLILYPYLIYPFLITWLARRFSGPPSPAHDLPESELPRVAMVIAAYNEEAFMAEKLSNTWDIDYPSDRFELVIGSDGSEDATPRILESCADPRLRAFLFSRRRGKISVLNDLVMQTDAEILVMSDASTLYEPEAIRKLVRHFQDPRVGCVTGELNLVQEGGASGEGLYLKYERWIKRSEGRFGCIIGCVGAIFALRRSLYIPLPSSTLVEDFVLSMRILAQGYRVCSEPEAWATDPACASNHGEMLRKVRIGAGNYQAIALLRDMLLPRYGMTAFAFWGHKVLRWLVPLFLFTTLGLNLLLVLPFSSPGLPSGIYGFLLICQLGGLFISSLAYRLPPGSKLPRWTRPISYFYLMNFALFQGFLRYLAHTQPVTWERAEQG